MFGSILLFGAIFNFPLGALGFSALPVDSEQMSTSMSTMSGTVPLPGDTLVDSDTKRFGGTKFWSDSAGTPTPFCIGLKDIPHNATAADLSAPGFNFVAKIEEGIRSAFTETGEWKNDNSLCANTGVHKNFSKPPPGPFSANHTQTSRPDSIHIKDTIHTKDTIDSSDGNYSEHNTPSTTSHADRVNRLFIEVPAPANATIEMMMNEIRNNPTVSVNMFRTVVLEEIHFENETLSPDERSSEMKLASDEAAKFVETVEVRSTLFWDWGPCQRFDPEYKWYDAVRCIYIWFNYEHCYSRQGCRKKTAQECNNDSTTSWIAGICRGKDWCDADPNHIWEWKTGKFSPRLHGDCRKKTSVELKNAQCFQKFNAWAEWQEDGEYCEKIDREIGCLSWLKHWWVDRKGDCYNVCDSGHREALKYDSLGGSQDGGEICQQCGFFNCENTWRDPSALGWNQRTRDRYEAKVESCKPEGTWSCSKYGFCDCMCPGSGKENPGKEWRWSESDGGLCKTAQEWCERDPDMKYIPDTDECREKTDEEECNERGGAHLETVPMPDRPSVV